METTEVFVAALVVVCAFCAFALIRMAVGALNAAERTPPQGFVEWAVAVLAGVGVLVVLCALGVVLVPLVERLLHSGGAP